MSTSLTPGSDLSELFVIDADSHVTEPPDLWTSVLDEATWGTDVPRVAHDERRGRDRWLVAGRWGTGVADLAFTGWKEFPPSYPSSLEEADQGSWDPHARLRRMDEYGLYAQLLYPNVLGFASVFFLDIADVELRNRCVARYNDYLIEFASADPRRLIPLMWLPFWDVDAAVKELGRSVRRGHHGIVFPSNFAPVGLPPLADEHWNPIWEAAQHHELSINFHTGFQTTHEEGASALGSRASRADYTKQSSLFMLGNARTIADVVVYGVCHRFPRLQFVSVESGFGWMPYFAELLDWQWLNSGAQAAYPELDLLPSEYIRRQVHGTFWFEHETLTRLVDLYPDNVMFSTDFPHPTSLTPGPASFSDNPQVMIERNLVALSDDNRRKLLHENAARLYHIP